MSEYLRDMGLNTTMIVDTTSKWAESLKEIAYNLGDVPGDAGSYPSYMRSRLAEFYDRAGRVSCLGSPSREGSLTIIGTLAQTANKSDTLITSTLELTQGFWDLDAQLVKRCHLPPISWLNSNSKCLKELSVYYDENHTELLELRSACLKIMQREDHLMGQLQQMMNKETLPETDKFTLDVAQIIRRDFLEQNTLSPYDKSCPLHKTVWMLKNIVEFYQRGVSLLESSNTRASKNKVTAEYIRQRLGRDSTTVNLFEALSGQKFKLPSEGQEQLSTFYKKLNRDIHDAFDTLDYEQ
eukprot:TRINITY_DN3592_c0_g1_i2.p1 TRINITY_DN3592_c0_g1~~TRINITY_DN3592_c0_g1_i2.p1  ORF type:complete len:296 (-),score=52.80 TRINITY_DN3592_c0_g1_i2:36-923(-)